MTTWKNCKRILCVRPDNMGDVLMSAPAITALRETFGSSVSLLTSSMGRDIARYIPAIDEIITWDVPWVKGTENTTPASFNEIVYILRQRSFDAAVIFTVFSQNPLPTALLLTLAGIPLRLAYCRENPYHLLTHWVPDDEPYSKIRHQVQRDLDLVATVSASVRDDRIPLSLPRRYEEIVRDKLRSAGVDTGKAWIVMHPGVSEKKREYPAEQWIEAGRRIADELGQQLVVTGGPSERALVTRIAAGIGDSAFPLAGSFALEELITLIRFTPLLISVNTGTIHIAAALQTRVIVLYAMTNPQHTPWKATGKVLPYSVPEAWHSRNEVLRYLQHNYFGPADYRVTADDILDAARGLLIEKREPLIDDILPGMRAYGMRKTLNFQAP